MMRKAVSPRLLKSEDGWAVKREGEDEPVCTEASKEKALDAAKKRAEESSTMVYICNEHGRIEEQLVLGKDS